MGRLGYAMRGAIFLVVAWLMYRAAANQVPNEAGNIEKALDVLRGPFLLPIAAGLFLFGLSARSKRGFARSTGLHRRRR